MDANLEEWDFGKDYVQEKEWKIMWHDNEDQGRPHFMLDHKYNLIGTVGGYLGLFIGFLHYLPPNFPIQNCDRLLNQSSAQARRLRICSWFHQSNSSIKGHQGQRSAIIDSGFFFQVRPGIMGIWFLKQKLARLVYVRQKIY